MRFASWENCSLPQACGVLATRTYDPNKLASLIDYSWHFTGYTPPHFGEVQQLFIRYCNEADVPGKYFVNCGKKFVSALLVIIVTYNFLF